MMKIVLLTEAEKIKEGLRSLTEEFIGEYPYYSTWIQKNEATFKNGTRVVYELNDNEKIVGYMMIHFSSTKYAKINGIYVFPDCQKKGYAKKLCYRFLKNLKSKTMNTHISRLVFTTKLWFTCLNHCTLMLLVKIIIISKSRTIGLLYMT